MVMNERPVTVVLVSAISPPESFNCSLSLWHSFTVAYCYGRPEVSFAQENSV